jgi:SAM-dependent methyltransferase
MSRSMSDWISFWDSKHSVYVSARHLDAHYRRVADDLLRYVPEGGAVLDYGCGEARAHGRIAAVAARLMLCDAAPGVRALLAEQFSTSEKIEVDTPEDIDALPGGEIDLIVMHSVSQYLSDAQFGRALSLFRRLLHPNGTLVLGDIIPPDVSPVTDATAMLRFAAQEGFLTAAVAGLARTAFSNYARLRSTLGLKQYSEPAMIEQLAEAGFKAERAARNIGHNPARMTFVARPV